MILKHQGFLLYVITYHILSHIFRMIIYRTHPVQKIPPPRPAPFYLSPVWAFGDCFSV